MVRSGTGSLAIGSVGTRRGRGWEKEFCETKPPRFSERGGFEGLEAGVATEDAQNRNRTSHRNQGWAQWAVSVAQVMAPPKSTRLQIDWRRPGPMLKYDTPPPSGKIRLLPPRGTATV